MSLTSHSKGHLPTHRLPLSTHTRHRAIGSFKRVHLGRPAFWPSLSLPLWRRRSHWSSSRERDRHDRHRERGSDDKRLSSRSHERRDRRSRSRDRSHRDRDWEPETSTLTGSALDNSSTKFASRSNRPIALSAHACSQSNTGFSPRGGHWPPPDTDCFAFITSPAVLCTRQLLAHERDGLTYDDTLSGLSLTNDATGHAPLGSFLCARHRPLHLLYITSLLVPHSRQLLAHSYRLCPQRRPLPGPSSPPSRAPT